MSKYQELINLNEKVQKLVNQDDVDWELKFDLVFSPDVSRRIFQIFDELNVSFDYYDPDTSYEEDVLALSTALEQKIQEIKKVAYMFEKEQL